MTRKDKWIAAIAFAFVMIINVTLLFGSVALTVITYCPLFIAAYVFFLMILFRAIFVPYCQTWQDVANHTKMIFKKL